MVKTRVTTPVAKLDNKLATAKAIIKERTKVTKLAIRPAVNLDS